MIGRESRIDAEQVPEAAEQRSRSAEQRDSDRDLRADQDRTKPALEGTGAEPGRRQSNALTAPRGLMNLECGDERAQNDGASHNLERERDDAPIDAERDCADAIAVVKRHEWRQD